MKTNAIASAKLKTDKVDALMLANLLRGGYIAECYVPSRQIMSLRELVRYRVNLVRIRGTLKNRVHAYLLLNNIKIDAAPFMKGFLEELEGYLRIIDKLNVEIHEASRMISFEARLFPDGSPISRNIGGAEKVSEVVVDLDVHLKSTQVTIMKNDLIGEIIKIERIDTKKVNLTRSLASFPKGTKVALESVGF